MIKILFIALIVIIAMDLIYWSINKIALWWTDKKLYKETQKEFDNLTPEQLKQVKEDADNLENSWDLNYHDISV